MKTSIIIPTVNRRRELLSAVKGCLDQRLADGEVEILVVDNSRTGTQRWILDACAPDASPRIRLRCIHQPIPGLSQARNSGIAAAEGSYIVFLDDDETPDKDDWLTELISAIEFSNADAAFGPVVPRYDERPLKYAAFIERLYTRDLSRQHGEDVTAVRYRLGSGNSCFRKATCFVEGAPAFNPRYDATGGEDTEFIGRLALSQKRLVWAPGARVHEFVPADRMSSGYLRSRRYAQGQMRSAVNVAGSRRRFDLVLFWMLVGSAQFFYHVVAMVLKRLAGNLEAAEVHAIQSSGGLGKVLWHRAFRKPRYGVDTAPT